MREASRKTVDARIRRIAARIAKRFRPDQIILFGSHARNEGGPDSDVDLLVVMPVKGSRREAAIEIGVAVADIRIPKDIVVTTPEDAQRRREIIGTIEYPAFREGRLLYAKR